MKIRCYESNCMDCYILKYVIPLFDTIDQGIVRVLLNCSFLMRQEKITKITKLIYQKIFLGDFMTMLAYLQFHKGGDCWMSLIVLYYLEQNKLTNYYLNLI